MRQCSARRTGLATVVALSALGCAAGSCAAPPLQPPPKAASAATEQTILAAPAPSRALPAQDRIAVLGVATVPASLQVDGQLAEWAIFPDGSPTPLTPSFLIVAATKNSVVLAGRVRNLQHGLWLRLENEAPEFPPIGSLQRGGGISPLQCTDEPGIAVFDLTTCHALMEHYDELQASYAALFVRQLHVTPEALLAKEGPQEQPIAGAQYAARTAEGAVVFEAVLPLNALPRIAAPELSALLVTPERIEAAPAHEAAFQVAQSVAFAEPIRFGIDSELLGCLWQGMSTAGFATSPRFSYQPGQPNRIYSAQNTGGFEITMNEASLSSPEGALGPLEVRTVHAASPLTAVLKGDKLVGCSNVGDLLGVVQRGRGLHVIGYNRESDESDYLESASFSVLEIDRDGTLHDELLETLEAGFGYTSVGQTHAKDLTSFSISGMYRTDDGGSQQHTLSWRYNPKLNRYGLSQRKGRYVAPNPQE